MRKKQISGRLWGLTAGAAAVLLLAGSAAPRSSRVCATQEATVLEYKMAEGRVLQYQLTSLTKEVADVMGQTLEGETRTKGDYSFRPKGRRGNDHLLEVTVNNLATDITSTQGSLSLDLSPVIGKTFDMVLSPLGVEVDVSGAEAITFEARGTTRNIASGFKALFPDLPGRPLKVGDSWPLNYTVEDKSSAGTTTITIEGVNTLEGFETVEGLECARILSKYSGSLSGQSQLQGMDMALSGTIKGTDVTYFAPREGIYVQSKTDLVREITATLSGPQNLTIPSTQTSTVEFKLVAR